MHPLAYRFIAALGIVATLTGCQSDLTAMPPLGSAVLDDASYKIGPGDKLSLVVFGAKDLSADQLTVAAEGTIAVPLVGDVKASGLTIGELTGAVRQRLMSGYVKDPKVTLQILSYRPFFILGEVKTPGEYPFVPGMTVTNAAALAGGFTPRAYQQAVSVTRGGSSFRATVTSKLLPDDVVKINERYF
jgi:polysaccharide export outer membrane protein